jgi:hypothetical protein
LSSCVKEVKRWEQATNAESVPAAFVGAGLCPIQGLKIVKRHVEILIVKGGGIRKNVLSGTEEIRIILKATTYRRR